MLIVLIQPDFSQRSLLIPRLLLHNTWALVGILFKTTRRNLVEAENALVRILDEDKLAVLALQAHISDSPHDTPSIGQLKIHLVCEILGLPSYDTQDNVLVICLGVCAGYKSGPC